MVQLAPDDLRAVLRASVELTEVPSLRDFPTRTLGAVRRLIDADMVTYNRMAVGRREALFAADPAFDTTQAQEVLAHYAEQNPLVANFVATGDTSARRFSDFWDQPAYHRTNIYGDLYRAFHVEYQMAAVVAGDADLFVGIGLNRSSHDFSERDRQVLDLLLPHIAAAHARVTWRQLALSATPGSGSIRLDRRRAVATVDPDAARWLAHTRKLQLVPGHRLPADLDDWVLAQLRSLTDPQHPALGHPLRLGPPEDGLVLRAVPEIGGVQVVLHRTGWIPGAARLALLGLTQRQAQVLWWLTRGRSTASVATRLGISPATVNTHVNHILRRLEVRSRTEAVALARDLLDASSPIP